MFHIPGQPLLEETFVYGNGTDQISVDAPADYTVIVKEPVSQCTDSKTITVTKNTTVPVITLPSLPDPITCTNTTSTVEASADPAFDFHWSGPGSITDPAAATTTVDKAGTYTITVTDPANGCSASKNLVVGENTTAPALTIDPPATITCTTPADYPVGLLARG